MIQVNAKPLESFIDRLQVREPFAFSRWGDGEWRSVLGKNQGVNCDKHWFFPDMGHQLAEVLKSRPRYWLSMQPFALRLQPLGDQIQRWLEANCLLKQSWWNADVFHQAAMNGRLTDLMSVLQSKPLVVVGPSHLRSLAERLDGAFVEAPAINAFEEKDRLIQEVRKHLESRKATVVSLSIGMSAGLVLDQLWKSHGRKHTIIDFGSVWDPLCGVLSRTYMGKQS